MADRASGSRAAAGPGPTTDTTTNMTTDITTESAAGGEKATTGELVGRASEQLSTLVRTEMELARVELNQTVKHAVTGAGLFGAAGLLAFYGGGTLVATVVLLLALVLDAWIAAVIVAVALFAAAGIAALVGKKQVDQAPAPVQNSIGNVKTDVDTVKRKAQR